MAMWVSVEAIVATTYFAAVLALLWVWRGKPAYLNQTVVFFAGLLASLSVALIVERPPSQWTAPLYDSISVVHWALAAAAAGAWVMIAAVARRFGTGQDYRLRLAGALAGALIPALVMAVVFPRFFLGPFADYSWPYLQQWLYTIEEYGPLLALSPERIVLLADELGPVLIAVGYTIYRLRRGGRTERQLMALLLLGFAGFIGLALDSVRWIVYAQALAWLPWTLAALTIFDRNPKLAIFRRRIPVRAPLIGLFLTVPALVALALTPRAPVAQAASLPHCDWPRMAAYLADRHGRENGSEQLLLTGIFIGPSLVWSTPYNVVGAPYGNARSLTDTFGFFGAVDDRAPREIVTRRDVDLVLVCRSSDERQYYSKPGGRDLFDRLAADMPPPWLEPVRLPDALAGAFRLYSVARSSRSPDAVAR